VETGEIRVDKFLVVRRLGKGGMGTVYEGYDPALDRRVAIKTLTGEAIADEESRKRFEREARAAAKLQHPNIVTIYELGNFGRKEKPYIVMEYLEGADIAALIEESGGLSLVETLDIAIQLCRGLGYAHREGVVHRDVKPSNLRYLDDGRVKIMDFGIARIEGSDQITRSGVMVGTLHYMSPEQIRDQPIDGRSDIFSAGCILYEMLTGKRPFPGETPTSILYKIVNEEPRPVLEVHPDLPQEVQDILAKALAKKPEDRYASAADMARELERLQTVFRRSFVRPGPALEAKVAELNSLVKERRWTEVARLAEGLLQERPDLEEPHRALRVARRHLRQEEAQRLETPEEKTRHLAEISHEFRMLYGPESQPTMVDAAGVPTRVSAPAGADELMLRSRTGVASETGARTAPTVWIVRVAALLAVAGALAWAVSSGWFGPRQLAGTLRVTSQPAGAAIWIDGRDSGRVTDADLPLSGLEGTRFAVELRKEGFSAVSSEVVLGSAPIPPLALTLTALERRATLVTEPPGAQVTLDGKPLPGTTPLEVALADREEHELVVSKAGYASRRFTVGPEAPVPSEKVVLEALAKPGTLLVKSGYPLAVHSGNRPLAPSSISPSVQLRPGSQEVTLYAPEVFLNRTVRVTIVEGETELLEAPGLGSLSVRASPSNCVLTIDGIRAEPPPFDNKPIVSGTHRFEFEWPDGRKQSEVKEVIAGQRSYVTGRAR
jgi:serine/threonine-protein kinase